MNPKMNLSLCHVTTLQLLIYTCIVLMLSVHVVGLQQAASMSTSSTTSTTSNKNYYNYFAFGSNMASSTMTALRNLEPVASTAAVLPDHRLAFNVPGTPLVEPSWASIEPKPSNGPDDSVGTCSNVHGVLYKLTEQDFEAVCNTEGIPFGYTLHRCRVIPYKGNGDTAGEEALQSHLDGINDESGRRVPPSIFAFTLRASREEWRKAEDTPPSRAYLNVLIRGSEEYQLDQQYVEFLKDIVPGKTMFGNGVAQMMLEAAERRSSFR